MINDGYLEGHGKTREEILGHTVTDLIGPKRFEKGAKALLDKCLAGKEVRFQIWSDFTKFGHRLWDMIYYPCFDVSGDVMGIAVSSRDITDLMPAEMANQHNKTISTIHHKDS